MGKIRRVTDNDLSNQTTGPLKRYAWLIAIRNAKVENGIPLSIKYITPHETKMIQQSLHSSYFGREEKDIVTPDAFRNGLKRAKNMLWGHNGKGPTL